MDTTKNYYRTLGVRPTAELEAIQKAYLALAARYHPDNWRGKKSIAEQKMQEINEAYEVLSDNEAREQYDKVRRNFDEYEFENDATPDAFNSEAEENSARETNQKPSNAVQDAHRILHDPWQPPPELLRTASTELPTTTRIPLADVIRVLAFRGGRPPEDMPEIVRAAHRMRSATVLFDAAREGAVVLYGTRVSDTKRERGRIDAFEFDMRLRLGSDDNAIEPDLGADALPMTDFAELRRRHRKAHSWRDVTVERKSLFSWLNKRAQQVAEALDKSAAVIMVASMLEQDKNCRFKDVFNECRQHYRVSERGFRSSIWPEARELAGLSRRARPGRKQKSSH
jgi:curved DNA-binding protein CbpA